MMHSSSSNASPSPSTYISTFGFEWTTYRSDVLYMAGNVIRVVSIVFLIAHAYEMTKPALTEKADKTSHSSLFWFAVLNWIDILTRYPLAYRISVMRYSIIFFSSMFLIVLGLYAVTQYGPTTGLVILSALAASQALLLGGTRPVVRTSSPP